MTTHTLLLISSALLLSVSPSAVGQAVGVKSRAGPVNSHSAMRSRPELSGLAQSEDYRPELFQAPRPEIIEVDDRERRERVLALYEGRAARAVPEVPTPLRILPGSSRRFFARPEKPPFQSTWSFAIAASLSLVGLALILRGRRWIPAPLRTSLLRRRRS